MDPKVLGKLLLLDCEATCAWLLDDCIDEMTADYEDCLEKAYLMIPSLQKNAIKLCDRLWKLDATACGAAYVACGLGCLCPFSLTK